MRKRIKTIVRFFVLAGICLGIVLYIGIGVCYRKRFAPGTFINGIYCTGKTAEEVNKELKELYPYDSILVQGDEGVQFTISYADIAVNIDYTGQLKKLKSRQNPFLWITALFGGGHTSLMPELLFEEEVLRDLLADRLAPADEALSEIVEIRRKDGYELFDGRKHVLNFDLVCSTVSDALQQGKDFVDISGCYEDLPYTEEMYETLALWEKVEAFQNCSIVYDMGDEKVPLTPEMISGFIALDAGGRFLLDDAGNLVLNEEAVEAFIDSLCQEYDTLGSARSFQSTRGEVVTVEGGTYGNKIDREAEIAYLMQALSEHADEVHIPAYEMEARVRGRDDIGDTYVEVDMTEQRLYYYEEGELLLETDVVTGSISGGHKTPSGVNFVYAMQRNRILRGPDYESFVKYWAPVNGGIGIHDASWRGSFGGKIYKTNGSHGCINVPPAVMATLYDMLEIGVPVVMFY
ncbi:MAG: L,D-transpeptidase family protein [Lachnospiraceae bacterium]|nr:L,D-transpeptidase family protein [Lachnospiraceae bacterium]